MVGSLQEFQPYLIKVTAKQDILFCGDGDRDAVAFSIKWAEIGSLVLNKVSAAPEITEGNSSYSLKNAKYGLYNEGELYQEITTDEYGTAEVLLPYGTYELKELEAPLGYAIDQEVHEVSVDSEQTTFEHKEQIAPVEEKIVKTDYSPKTGDNNCMGLAVTVLVAASVMMVSVIKKKEV